jgi:hypothetical protein
MISKALLAIACTVVFCAFSASPAMALCVKSGGPSAAACGGSPTPPSTVTFQYSNFLGNPNIPGVGPECGYPGGCTTEAGPWWPTACGDDTYISSNGGQGWCYKDSGLNQGCILSAATPICQTKCGSSSAVATAMVVNGTGGVPWSGGWCTSGTNSYSYPNVTVTCTCNP